MDAPGPVHFYHLWAGDRYHGSAWEKPAQEHFAALAESGFSGEVHVGLVGGLPERLAAIAFLLEAWPAFELSVQDTEGFEQVTIEKMHAWCMTADPLTPVLYAHTKGSLNSGPSADAWRRSMTRHVVTGWRECVNSLHTYDAAGCHWLTHEQYPENINPRAPMFGGNFWWANAGYLAALPPVGHQTRWHAEGWMGQGFPKVADLLPGWPRYP